MSHHFDTPTAREDPRINVCDFYLFAGAPGTTVMAMTVNPDAGLSAPETFREEGLYAFRFDLDGDAREEVTFKFRFGAPDHAEGDDHRHIQNFQVIRATGGDAQRGLGGEVVLEGQTGKVQGTAAIRVFAGLAPDVFAGNAAGLKGFMTAFYQEQRYAPEAFANRQNFFARRNVSAIVLEVPNEMIGASQVHAWATASLAGHAPEVQVSRWGLPLLTHILLSDPGQPNLKEDFNRSTPSEDVARFSGSIARFVETMTTYAEKSAEAAVRGKQIAARFCPATLPYELGTPAAFQADRFNGRSLAEDAMDVILELASGKPLNDGAAPDASRMRAEFPYYGEPYTRGEQQGMKPAVAR